MRIGVTIGGGSIGVPGTPAELVEQACAAAEVFARYGGLENYQRQLEREGASSVADLAVVGDEDEVRRALRSYADVGVTDLWATVFPVGPDADASVRRTRALLAGGV